MKPEGRQYTKTNCKRKVKENGKHIPAYWEDIPPNKTKAKVLAEKEMEIEVEVGLHDYIEDKFNPFIDTPEVNWDCSLEGSDLTHEVEGECISCDWHRQMKASSGWDDPNFIESWDFDIVWLQKWR